MGQFFTNGIALSYTATGSYVAIDLSAHVPVGTTGVAIRVVKSTIYNIYFGIRALGATDDLYMDTYGQTSQMMYVKCTDRQIEIKTPTTHNYTFYLMGYFEDEAVFLSTRTDVTPGVYASWQTVTLTSLPNGGNCFALFEVCGTGSGSTYDRTNVRRTGSTDNRTGYDIFYSDRHYGIVSGSDSSKQVDIWTGGARHKIYLVGYIIAACSDINTNAIDIGVTSSTFADKDLDTFDTVPANTICAVMEVSGNIQGTWDVRCDGSTDDFSTGVNYAGLSGDICVKPGTGNIIEAEVQSTTIDCLIKGFITLSPAPVANFTATPLIGPAPLSVSFTDTSTNSPTSWSWLHSSYGGLYTEFSTSQHPTYVFNTPGIYSIRLIVANAAGSNTLTRTNYITVSSTGGSSSATLPKLTNQAGTNGTAVSPPSLPSSSMVADSPGVISTLPMMLLQGGGYWTIPNGGRLPMFTLSGWMYQSINVGAVTLPFFSISSSFVTPHSGIMILPKLSGTGTSIAGIAVILQQNLPRLGMVGATSIVGNVGISGLTLPRFSIVFNSISGTVSTLDKILPAIRLSATGIWYVNIDSTAVLSLPMLVLTSFGQNIVVPVSDLPAIVLNARNNAVSRYVNYNFNSLTQYQDIGLGAKSDGIYLLNGASDDGTPINSELSSYLWDMKIPTKKRVVDVYMSMRTDGTYVFQLQTDDGMLWETELTHSDWNMKTNKIHTPKGSKGKYWNWKLKSKDGAKIDLDSLEFLVEVLKSRV